VAARRVAARRLRGSRGGVARRRHPVGSSLIWRRAPPSCLPRAARRPLRETPLRTGRPRAGPPRWRIT